MSGLSPFCVPTNKKEIVMSKKQALQSFNQELHISYSQIEGRQPERISISLSFGSAIHSAIEMATWL